MLAKIIMSVLIFLETIVCCYAPKLINKLAKYKNDWFNVDNLNNATSGALLALAITHLLPEGFQYDCKRFTILKSVDMRGFIVVAPILLLVTIDFLAGHHCGSQAKEEPHLAIPEEDISGDVENNGCFDNQCTTSTSCTSDVLSDQKNLKIEVIMVNLRMIFSTRSLYLLLAFYGHSVLEGSLIGSETGSASWAMGFGILAHKWAECLVLISILSNIIYTEWIRHLCILLFSLCVPIGVFVGHHTVSKSDGICYTVFSLLAVGFFIYLSFELFTGNTGQKTSSRIILLLFFILGSLIMSIILALSNVLESKS
ncbi:zinc transport protein [Theileria orientalis]|uniref:Zinc transport protein n=1 Tax=Theileria orientalis TaxID=68886 RepID=A0A976MBB1_THEOR|nr:zinc transport protein [Theileria orientalis]